MSSIKDEVLSAAHLTGARVSQVPRDASENILNKIGELYTGGSTSWTMWEKLENKFSVFDEHAWLWLKEFLEGEVIMFFNQEDEKAMFSFEDGSEVVPVLENCYGFEFYITSPSLDYLICFNHEDYLITAGTAMEWLKKRQGR